jgi:hypothetical protein
MPVDECRYAEYLVSSGELWSKYSSAKPSCSAGEIRDADVVSIALLSSAGISAELMTSSRLRYAGEILVEYVQHAYL